MNKFYLLEIGEKSEKETLLQNGKRHKTIGVRIKEQLENRIVVHNVCMTVRADNKGEYIDFSITRFKHEFGKIYLDEKE